MNNLFKINGNPEQYEDLDVFYKLAQQFLPYAQQSLGFDKPVGVNLLSDPENVKDPLGKTAYYDPSKMEITLFVDKRHVKDVLRSMAHELVHHTQNCRGEFDGGIHTGPGYAQDDEHMRKMEAEAYLKGSGFLLRDWEDSLKKENQVMSEAKIQEERSIFAPNHYCIHHGGVYMEGEVKLGKVINHNWNEGLQKVTKYDMQLSDGTILENVKAEDILVTEASLAKEHGMHAAQRDEDELEEGEKPDFPDVDGDGNRTEPISQAQKQKKEKGGDKKKKDLSKVPPQLRKGMEENVDEGKGKLCPKCKKLVCEPHCGNRDEDYAKQAKKAAKGASDVVKKAGAKKAAKDAADKILPDKDVAKVTKDDEDDKKKVAKPDTSPKRENWTRGNKNQLLFERLVEKWIK